MRGSSDLSYRFSSIFKPSKLFNMRKIFHVCFTWHSTAFLCLLSMCVYNLKRISLLFMIQYVFVHGAHMQGELSQFLLTSSNPPRGGKRKFVLKKINKIIKIRLKEFEIFLFFTYFFKLLICKFLALGIFAFPLSVQHIFFPARRSTTMLIYANVHKHFLHVCRKYDLK